MIEKRISGNREENSTGYLKDCIVIGTYSKRPVYRFVSENSIILTIHTIYHTKDTCHYFLKDKGLKIIYPERDKFNFYINGKVNSMFSDEYAVCNAGNKYSNVIPQFKDKVSKVRSITFRTDIFEDILKEQGLNIPSDGLILDKPIKTKTPLLRHIIQGLFNGAEEDFFEDEMFLELMLRELAVYLLYVHKGNYRNLIIDSRKDVRIKKTMEFIKDNYTRKFSLKELAKESCIGKDRLIQLLKKETGQTPWQYLNAYKIEKAKELLKNKNNMIENISYELGYSNRRQFERIFKKYISLTPSEFKNQHK